jgi:hypothetical protein
MRYKTDYEKTMSLQDELKLGMQSIEMDRQGSHEEAGRIRRQIPLSPHMAMWATKRMGADFLVQSGWNLADTEAAFRPDWLNK